MIVVLEISVLKLDLNSIACAYFVVGAVGRSPTLTEINIEIQNDKKSALKKALSAVISISHTRTGCSKVCCRVG